MYDTARYIGKSGTLLHEYAPQRTYISKCPGFCYELFNYLII